MTRVRVQDLRVARLCMPGARLWFRRQGFNWQDFLDNGIEADKLLATGATGATGETLAEPVIAIAKARERCDRCEMDQAQDGR